MISTFFVHSNMPLTKAQKARNKKAIEAASKKAAEKRKSLEILLS